MSHIGKVFIKISLLTVLLWGGYQILGQNFNAKSTVSSQGPSAASVHLAKVEKKIDRLQKRTKPIKREFIKKMRPVTSPVKSMFQRLETRISLIGVIFIAVLGLVLLMFITAMARSNDYI